MKPDAVSGIPCEKGHYIAFVHLNIQSTELDLVGSGGKLASSHGRNQ